MKELSKAIIILVFIMFSTKCLATFQTSDLLIIGDDTIHIYQFPLDQFFKQNKFHNPGFFSMLHTGCWRGYRAVWIIHDDKLFLKEIYDCDFAEKVSIENIGRNKDSQGLILADWFNGQIKINLYKKEEIFDYWNFGRLFINKLTIKVKNGEIETNRKLNKLLLGI